MVRQQEVTDCKLQNEMTCLRRAEGQEAVGQQRSAGTGVQWRAQGGWLGGSL